MNNTYDNTILDDITKRSTGCAVQCKPDGFEKVTELDHVFMIIQQILCGQPKGLVNVGLKYSQWPGCLQHVMSGTLRIVHSGCLWARWKSAISLIQASAGFSVFPSCGFYINSALIKDTMLGPVHCSVETSSSMLWKGNIMVMIPSDAIDKDPKMVKIP